MNTLNVKEAHGKDAEAVLRVIQRSFGARPVLDPPAPAMSETVDSVRAVLESAGGLLVERRGEVMGGLLFDESRDGQLGLTRVSVDPRWQNRGVASAMVGVAEDIAEERGYDGIWLNARLELPEMVEFWSRRKYLVADRQGSSVEFGKTLWLSREAHSITETQLIAQRVAGLLRAGDLLVLSGDLGAGKTTFTQALGEELGVRGPITSPTFVISRVHPSLVDGPALVHVDAYRLGDALELDDLDLDASVDEAVTVVEWGEGKAEQLASSYLLVSLERRTAAPGDPVGTKVEPLDEPDDPRVITIRPFGPRWLGVPLRSTLLS